MTFSRFRSTICATTGCARSQRAEKTLVAMEKAGFRFVSRFWRGQIGFANGGAGRFTGMPAIQHLPEMPGHGVNR
jgi:hypothetical protein